MKIFFLTGFKNQFLNCGIAVIEKRLLKNQTFNSHAEGLAFARRYGFEIDFVRHPISGSASWFFICILKFILTSIFEIKIHTEKFLDTEKISFSKSDSQKR